MLEQSGAALLAGVREFGGIRQQGVAGQVADNDLQVPF
jgi:hypothetical protein